MREERIGDCRLILGDCLEVMPKIDRADHVITDPPFEKEAHTAMRRTQKSIRTGELAALNFGAIDDDTRLLVAAWSKMKCDGWLLAFCQVEAVASWRDAMEVAGLKYKRGMVWVKPDSSPQFNGQMPAQGFECIASAWCGAGHSSWNGGGRRGVFTHNTNWPGRHGVHPTEKPVPLMTELVGLFTDIGQVVLDPFMGSGSTLVACARLGRAAIGIEKDPEYFRVACERVDAATRQSDLFITPPPKPEQTELFSG